MRKCRASDRAAKPPPKPISASAAIHPRSNQYNYTAGANNGQISGTVDYLSGETVTFPYDSLKRLATAQTGPSGPQWGEAHSYDGFGNLTGKTPTKGSAPGLVFTCLNNR